MERVVQNTCRDPHLLSGLQLDTRITRMGPSKVGYFGFLGAMYRCYRTF